MLINPIWGLLGHGFCFSFIRLRLPVP